MTAANASPAIRQVPRHRVPGLRPACHLENRPGEPEELPTGFVLLGGVPSIWTSAVEKLRILPGWLPLRVDVELTECLFEVAGEERALQVLHNNMANTFDSMVLKPILDGAFGIFGCSPAKMLKWSPKVWYLLYRNCGQLVLAKSDDRSAVLKGTTCRRSWWPAPTT